MSSVGSAGLSERSAGVGAFTGTAAGTSFAMTAENRITALYRAHALGLTRLAHVMLSDAGAAEDVVQEAFCGLYRNWARIADPAAALPYLRASVLNGCRSAIRRRRLRASKAIHEPAPAADPCRPGPAAFAALVADTARRGGQRGGRARGSDLRRARTSDRSRRGVARIGRTQPRSGAPDETSS